MTSSDHGFKVTRRELRMILGGDRVAAISDDLVRIMSRAGQRDSAFRERDNCLFMREMGRELSRPLLQHFIGYGRR